MTLEEIKALVHKFESKVVNAWVYDTKLENEEYISSVKMKKADLLMNEADELRKTLMQAIEESINHA